ncbi:hypothetical protein [Nocardia gamkensis]|uniref:Integrase n=1 Tax=Nocardia gamkensis TaxID=352869 RepID=A0A7X6L940_9NOCA|nr:hypothetical protein [Nocardia gamkensis]NKY29915.1 hypothetical protein [Nocardia gamkensis]NQE68849.1 hypothetical protein [Nocardia gamkensis]
MTDRALDVFAAHTVSAADRWPRNETLVLLDRELLPGTDPARLSRFGDDRWHLNEAIFEAGADATSLNFAAIPIPMQLTAKHYVWQLINTECPAWMRWMRVSRPSILSIDSSWASLKEFLVWLHRHDVTELQDVTAELLDDYLIDLSARDMSPLAKHKRIREVRRLWSYRDALPEQMRLPPLPPWGGDRSHELLGKIAQSRANLTPRIAEKTMQPLLAWSLRFVEDFAEDIIAAYAEYRFLDSRSMEGRRRTGPVIRSPKGRIEGLVIEYLDRLRCTGGSLPGRITPDGIIEIDWPHLGRIFECAPHGLSKAAIGQAIRESGIPVADNAYLETPITGRLSGQLWLDRPIAHFEARTLARHLSAACAVIIAYLSGARAAEVLNLERGCIEYDPQTDLLLMSGTYFKHATDDRGNKIPQGAPRRDPWVVVEPVAEAAAVLERLHDHPLLFANNVARQRYYNSTRKGEARLASIVAKDLESFTTWINTYSVSRGIDGVPADPQGPLNLSRFRRTLAWSIRRRPRGVVAGALQYGHVETRMFQGYAGTYESGFPDDYAFEDFLARLDEIAENHRALAQGEHVSGPAADDYGMRVSAAHKQFGGHVLSTGKQARDLVNNPLLQIFHGKGMTCVFDPAQAACQLRGTADDPMVTPDIDDCRPRCPNIARTGRDIAEIRKRRDELAEIVADPLAPPIRHRREQHELDRLDTILENHQ